jgi:hypothetical protein
MKKQATVTSYLSESTQPYKVRTSCGHIVIRRMREATAGVAYSESVVLEAPNGRPCDACIRPSLNARVRVRIADPSEYAMGAAEKLNGAIGTVIAVRPDYSFTKENGYLVQFDKPVGRWPQPAHPNPTIAAFHFVAKDLEVLS